MGILRALARFVVRRHRQPLHLPSEAALPLSIDFDIEKAQTDGWQLGTRMSK